MIPNVYEWVRNVLLKVYSSLNMHHLIRERFHEGVDLSLPVTHSQSHQHLLSSVQREPICDPYYFTLF